jgi:hypothetical protein
LSSRAWLGALAAIVVGAAAGYFVSHPLPLTRLLFEMLSRPVNTLLGGWLTTYDRYLVSSAVVYALPTILLLGLGLGLLLSRVRYPRLLMYAILLWPLWFSFSYLFTGRAAAGRELDLQANFFAYSLLFLLIVATRALSRPRAAAR